MPRNFGSQVVLHKVLLGTRYQTYLVNSSQLATERIIVISLAPRLGSYEGDCYTLQQRQRMFEFSCAKPEKGIQPRFQSLVDPLERIGEREHV